MELRRYFLIVRRWLWLIVLAPLVAAALTYGLSARETKLYRATATTLINQAGSSGLTTDYTDVLTSQNLAKTYATIATSWPVLTDAAKSMGLDSSAVSPRCTCVRLPGKAGTLEISTSVPLNTLLITVTAVSASPQYASNGANAVAASFSKAIQQSQIVDTQAVEQDLNAQIQQVQADIKKTQDGITTLQNAARPSNAPQPVEIPGLQSQVIQQQSALGSLTGQLANLKLAESKATNAVKVVTPARQPESPFTPNVLRNSAFASVLGLLAGLGLAVVLEYLDDRVTTPADVEQAAAGIPTLGIIERLRSRRAEGGSTGLLLSAGSGSSPALEAYRLLRSNLEFATATQALKTLVVTSARPDEGKSTTAANLAIVLSQTGRRILLIDADFRRPSLHLMFGLPNSSGLSTLFLMQRPDVDALYKDTEYEHLRVLTTGPLPPNPTELISSPRMHEIIALLSASAEILIFDSSPLLAVADASELAARVDGVMLVVDTSRTRPQELAQASEVLQRASARFLGVALNKLQRKQTARSDSYYYYAYRDRDTSRNGRHRDEE